jgi:hypothetical protein
MGSTGLDVLPVVSRVNRCELEGIVTLSGVLEELGVGHNRPAVQGETGAHEGMDKWKTTPALFAESGQLLAAN